MKKVWVLIIAILFTMPSLVSATVIEGTIRGFNCVNQGRCASSSEDPIVTTEYTFVVVTPDGKYYFLPNVPREVLAYRDTEKVRVHGNSDPKYNKINANTLEIVKNNKWR
jgi:hypothetical protein